MLDLLEILHQFFSEGLSWASGTALVLGFLKLRDGRHRRRVNEELRNDIKDIKEHLGCRVITSEVNLHRGPMKNVRWSSRPWAALYPVNTVKLFTILRRKRQMNKSVNWVTLIVALLGAAKLVLEAFGISFITDDMIDKASNVVAALVTLVGVVMTHSKVKKVKEVVIDGQSTFTVPTESTK